jgi:3-hydroxyacyl-CoA dehydrogenase
VEIRKVGVLGCGTMGSGICQVVARAGLPVTFVEISPEAVEEGMERIGGALQRVVDRGKLDAGERDAILQRISGDTSYDALADADLVIEAIPEQLELKRESFAELDRVLKPEAIVATNTSSLSVIDIAVATHRSDRVLGFHFFNPAPVMPLIELITTVVTDPEVVEVATGFAERIGKTPVVAKDRAGFVANLLLFPYLNQAVGMLEQGYATREDIDAAMKFGAGHPMGPLALMDLIGLDSANSILERMYEQFRDVRYAPRPLIRQLLVANYRGRKTGRGFYTYEAPNSPKIAEESATTQPADPETIAGWETVVRRLLDAREAEVARHEVDRGEHLLMEPLNASTGFYIKAARQLGEWQTRFQKMQIYDTPHYGKLFRLDGYNMTSEKEEFVYHENLMHPALTAHAAPKKVLIIGGGDGGSSEEALKHPSVESVTMVEIDADVIAVAKEHFQAVHNGVFDNPKLKVLIEDGLKYVRETQERFDLIALDLNDPVGPAAARY